MRARSGIDVAKLGAAVTRPGIDPRVWVTLGIVQSLGYDANEGLFADVQLQPSGEIETCFIGAGYAGGGFGMYCPIEVDDTVLVAVPSGDSGHGPVIISRTWDAGDKPHADFGSGTTPTSDVVLRMKNGAKLRIRTAGGSDDIDIQAEGAANIKLVAGGQIRMQDATQSFVRGEAYADQLNGFLNALIVFLVGLTTVMAALGAFATAVGVVLPPAIPLAVVLNTAITTFAGVITTFTTAITTFLTTQTTWLSTKVKGQ